MDDPGLIVALLGAGGGGVALLEIIKGLFKWLSGSSGRERARNTDLVSQRNQAVADRVQAEIERDKADAKRRVALDYAYSLKWIMAERGIEPPPMPTILETERNSNTDQN